MPAMTTPVDPTQDHDTTNPTGSETGGGSGGTGTGTGGSGGTGGTGGGGTGGSGGTGSGGTGGTTLTASPFLGLNFGLDDTEVRFYDRTTGTRLFFNPDQVTGLSVEITEAGGTDSIHVQVASLFDAAFIPTEGCIVEVIVLTDPAPTGRPEPHPRHRGILSAPEASLSDAESRSLIAYGLMEDMNHVPIGGSLIAPGGGDLSNLAAQALAAYAKERPWLVVESAIEDTGVLREIVDMSDSDCRKALDAIVAQAPGLVVWGWRVSALTGKNQFVLRARKTIVGNQFDVGKNVSAFSLPRELSKVANGILLTGGKSDRGNLLAEQTAQNTSFEKSEARGAAKGGHNLVDDYGFEIDSASVHILFLDRDSDSPWMFTGGSNSKLDSAAFQGTRVLELVGGSAVSQAIGSALTVVPGRTFIVTFQARRNAGTDTRTGAWKLTWKDAGGASVGAPVTYPFTPASIAYEEVRGAALCPDGAVSAVIELSSPNTGDGRILCDAIAVFDQGTLESLGWEVIPHGASVVEILDPNYTADFCPLDGFGRTCLRVRGTFSDADKQDGFLRPRSDAEISVKGHDSYRAAIRIKLPPGTDRTVSGKMKLVCECRKDDGTVDDTFFVVIAPGALSSVWQTFKVSFLNPSGATKVRYRLVFEGDIDVLVDCAQFREDAAGDEYIRGANWERAILATEVCDAGSEAYQSASKYDRRTRYVKNDSLKAWDTDAQAWAKAYLTKAAVPPIRARLSLSHEAVQIVDPLDGLLVRVSGVAIVIPDAYAARVSLDFSDPARRVQIDLGGEQPSLARLIAGGKNQTSVSAGGGGGASVSSAVGAAISGAIADTLPGVYAAQDAANAVAAEVIDARSRYAIAGSFVAYTYANLKNHLNAFWTALAKRTADPTGQPAGRVLTTDGSDGVAFTDLSDVAAGVSSVNGADGAITLAAGSGIAIAQGPAKTFTVSATGGGGGSGGSTSSGAVGLIKWVGSSAAYSGSGGEGFIVVTGDNTSSLAVHFEQGGVPVYSVITVINHQGQQVILTAAESTTNANGSGAALFVLETHGVCRLIRIPTASGGRFDVFVDTGGTSQTF